MVPSQDVFCSLPTLLQNRMKAMYVSMYTFMRRCIALVENKIHTRETLFGNVYQTAKQVKSNS